MGGGVPWKNTGSLCPCDSGRGVGGRWWWCWGGGRGKAEEGERLMRGLGSTGVSAGESDRELNGPATCRVGGAPRESARGEPLVTGLTSYVEYPLSDS